MSLGDVSIDYQGFPCPIARIRHLLSPKGARYRGGHPKGFVNTSSQILPVRQLRAAGNISAICEPETYLVSQILIDPRVMRKVEQQRAYADDVVSAPAGGRTRPPGRSPNVGSASRPAGSLCWSSTRRDRVSHLRPVLVACLPCGRPARRTGAGPAGCDGQ